MSAVSHYLESEGVPTAGISLVREHSEVMQPPRALWVPFMLGRPLGAPDDPAFQRSVLRAVLSLFKEPEGPVLRDFPCDAPVGHDSTTDGEGDACPVNFARPPVATGDASAMGAGLEAEIDQLRPWHDLARRRRGGTTVGLTGLSPSQAGQFLMSFLTGSDPPGWRPDQPVGQSLKQACDDLRAYYEEAGAAQPGTLSARAMEQWLYDQTIAGEVMLAVRRMALDHADPAVRAIADRTLIPRAILNRSKG